MIQILVEGLCPCHAFSQNGILCLIPEKHTDRNLLIPFHIPHAGSCKMMFPISYLFYSVICFVCLLITYHVYSVNYLVCLLLTTRTNRVEK